MIYFQDVSLVTRQKEALIPDFHRGDSRLQLPFETVRMDGGHLVAEYATFIVFRERYSDRTPF